jgi:DNA-3-methyladenine glycosylase II
LRSEVERILSLDVDGSGFPAVGRRDRVIGRLQRRLPGLRPVLFVSPYEAGAWALISHRVRIVQAARLKARMSKAMGERVDIHGDIRHAFPAPGRLAALDDFPGLFGRKAEWLRGLADAALGGELDAARLRALAPEAAISQLKELPGIGDFSAELVLLRGVGVPDVLPKAEPRLRRAVALAYAREGEPSEEEVAELAERWRPYRTWVAVLLRAWLQEQTNEIGAHRTGRG